MHKKLSITFFLLSFNFLFSINSQLVIKDTLSVTNKIPYNKELTLNLITQSQQTSSNKDMPWIAAIIVGFLTVLTNIIISYQTRRTTLNAISLQIANAKTASERDFNKTVLSGNRQNWINDLRNNISLIISKLSSFSLQQKISHKELQEINYLITKIKLMLNPISDKKFIESLNDLFLCSIEIASQHKTFNDLHLYEKEVLEQTQKTLKTEWERVKKGE